MNLFESVRAGVTAREAAERYGIKANRNGMACCPFHRDRHPSMKLDKRYHCFGCQEDGDAINLVEKLFDLETVDAARKLAEDFDIEYEDSFKKRSAKKDKQKQAATAEQRKEKRTMDALRRLEKWLTHAEEVLIRYRKWLEFWEEFYRPEMTDKDWHPLFCEALQNKSRIDYYLDILMCGDDYERLDFLPAAERR